MDEETLKRKAIEEIIREMDETKQKELQLTSERKVNPLGKPNKHFLGRTINSILTHNKRESERKNRNCQQKLKELEDRANRRMNNEYFNGKSNERSRSRSRCDNGLSSGLSSSEETIRVVTKRSTKRKKKRKRKKIKRRDSSTSSSSSSPSSSRRSIESYSAKQKLKSKPQYKAAYSESLEMKEEEGKYYHDYDAEYCEMVPAVNPAMEYYAQVNQHYCTLAATAACNQMSNIYQYSSMLATVSQIRKPPDNSSNDWGRLHTEEITEQNSIYAECLSLSVSSIGEDENGIPTIDVTTDNETSDVITASRRKKPTISTDSDVELLLNSATSSESSEEGDNVCIDLNSDSKSSSGSDSDSNPAIFSCSSESEKEVPATGQPATPEKHDNEVMIDLTKD